jgi:hypothetical protein
MTSYQGRWNGQKKIQARLSASAGLTAGSPGTRSGSRKKASTATPMNSASASGKTQPGMLSAPSGPARPNGR